MPNREEMMKKTRTIPRSAPARLAAPAALLFALFALTTLSGCVERRLAFTSTLINGGSGGEEVLIELDGEPIGKTPCDVGFIHYGEHEWVARADGRQVASGKVQLTAPWYQVPPFDFVAEALLPFTFTDRHEVEVKLEPLKPVDPSTLYQRAAAYRAAAEKEIADSNARNAPKDAADDKARGITRDPPKTPANQATTPAAPKPAANNPKSTTK
jgi:hypothetical protein